MAGNKNSGKKRKLTPLEEVLIINLKDQGFSILDIQIKFSISESTVHRILRRVCAKV